MKRVRAGLLLTSSILVLVASPGRANAPVGRFIDRQDGTILDTKTNLTWQKRVSITQINWAYAKDYCDDVGNGWRLPSVKELQTIVDHSQREPAIDRVAFPDTVVESYWSCTLAPDGRVWYVDFSNGEVGLSETTVPSYIRCVH